VAAIRQLAEAGRVKFQFILKLRLSFFIGLPIKIGGHTEIQALDTTSFSKKSIPKKQHER
jgi:hypothetical protein